MWKLSYAGLYIALESEFKLSFPAKVLSLYVPLDSSYLMNALSSFCRPIAVN